MPNSKLVISIDNTIGSGDFIQFELFNGFTVKFTSIAISPVLYEFFSGTIATVPGDLVDSIELIGSITDYYTITEVANTVEIEARFDDTDYNFRNAIGVGDFSFTITDAIPGGGAVPTPGIIDPVPVTNTDFDLIDLYGTTNTQNFIHGNIGDKVKATIDFTLPSAPVSVRIRWGLVSNSADVYSDAGSFAISDSLMVSLFSGDSQGYKGGIGSLSPLSPISAQQGSATLIDNGGLSYTIEHEMDIDSYIRNVDLATSTTLNIRDEFDGSASVKYIFKIEAFDSAIASEPYASTEETDLSGIFKDGNIGYLNEFLNGDPATYTLDSFSFDNTEDEINFNEETGATSVIETSGADFTAATDLILKIQRVPDSVNSGLTLSENINLDTVQLVADGTPVNGTTVTNVTASVDGGDAKKINLTFDIGAGEYQESYEMFVIVSNDAAINHNAIQLRVGAATATANVSDITMTTYPGAPHSDFNWSPHYDSNLADAYNHRKSFNGDHYISRFQITNGSSDKVIETFLLEFRSRTGQVFDSLKFNVADLPISTRKPYILKDTDLYGDVVITQIGSDYLFQFPVQVWENEIGVSDLVLQVTISGTQTLIDGSTTPFNQCFLDPDQTPKTYDQSGSDGPVFSLDGLIFQDALTLSDLGQDFVSTGETLVTARFSADTPPDLDTDETDLRGWLFVGPSEGSQNEQRFFSSVRDPEDDTPWVKVGVPNTALITKEDFQTATIQGKIDVDALKLAFPNVDKWQVGARLDRTPPTVVQYTKQVSLSFREPDLNEVAWQQDETYPNAVLISEIFSGDIPELSLTFKFNSFDPGVGGWGAIASQTKADWLTEMGNQSTFFFYASTNDTAYIDGGLIIEYVVPGVPSSPFVWTYDMPVDSIDYDTVVWFQNNVTFTSILGTNLQSESDRYGLRTSNPSGDNYTEFGNLVSLNNAIGLLSDGTNYGVHFHGQKSTSALSTITFTASYDNVLILKERSKHVGSNWNSEYRPYDPSGSIAYDESIDAVDLGTGLLSFFGDVDQAFTVEYHFEMSNQNFMAILQSATNQSPQNGVTLSYINSLTQFRYQLFLDGAPDKFLRRAVNVSLIDGQKYILHVTYDGSADGNEIRFYLSSKELTTTELINSEFSPGDTVTSTGTEMMHASFRSTPAGAVNQANPNKDAIMRIYNRVLTDEEIRSTFNDKDAGASLAGLIRDYDFAGVVSATLTDLTATENGTLINHTNTTTNFY